MDNKTIRELNDKLRHNIFSPNKYGKVVLTNGVSDLSKEDLFELLCRVRDFNDFNEGNDPYQEHDFGRVDFKGVKYFFKIDYYPHCHILTVMLAEEY